MKLEGFPKARDLRRISPGIVAVMLMMAGCATQNVQQIDWQHGAQRAWITRIYTPAELAGSDVDSCLANLPESERRAGQFAQVSYWQGRWRALKLKRT